MRRLASLALTAVLLAGCGSDISSGYVTEKKYEPSWTETRWTDYCAVYDAKTHQCKQMVRTPHYITHPERWRLNLRDGKETGYVYVSQMFYDRYQIGDHYPEPR